MNTNQTIRKALCLTYLVYDNYRSYCFESWCNKYSHQMALPLRALTTHDVLYNWYCHQWNVYVENAFYNDNKEYFEAGINDPENFQKLFMDYPKTIEKYYPKPILNTIKKAFKANDKTKLNKS